MASKTYRNKGYGGILSSSLKTENSPIVIQKNGVIRLSAKTKKK